MSVAKILEECFGGFVAFGLIFWPFWKWFLKGQWKRFKDLAPTSYVDKSVIEVSKNLKEKIKNLDVKVEKYSTKSYAQYENLDKKIDNMHQTVLSIAQNSCKRVN